MSKRYVLFNPKANNGAGRQEAEQLREVCKNDELTFIDVTTLSNYDDIFNSIGEDENIILCGGDGTVNRFVNAVTDEQINKTGIYYFATGTGNDFLNDLGVSKGEPILINKYLVNLPTAEIKGKTYKFLNGIGYGIDGYCCEVGDKLRETTDKPINYTAIAIKGLLFHFKPTKAKITVDGKVYEYKKVWLAPTMNGRMYGGGMIPTPNQDRLNEERTVSNMVYYGVGKLKALIVFPSIFKGEHVAHKDMVEIHTGKDILVEYEKPCAVQVDGETILDVSSVHIRSARA